MKTAISLSIGVMFAIALSVAGNSLAATDQEGEDDENEQASLAVVAPAALKKCVRCHNMSKDDKRKTKSKGGPVFGIFGEKPKKKSIDIQKWDEDTLDKYLENPKSLDPKSKMKFKVKDAKKRAEMIKALEELE